MKENKSGFFESHVSGLYVFRKKKKIVKKLPCNH